MPSRTPQSPSPGGRRHPALLVAAGLLIAQGLGFAVFGVLELASTRASRPVVGITTGVSFAAYAVLLVAAGRAVGRGRRWARSVAACTQILHVPVAWGFVGGTGTSWVGYAVIGLSVVVLTLLFLPSSTAVFVAGEPAD